VRPWRLGVMTSQEAVRSSGRQACTSGSTVALLIMLGGLFLSTRWLTLNIQPSVPYGLYRTVALPMRLEHGMLVTLWPPAVTHPWHPWYQRFLKPIAGLPGDQVCILDAGLWINGEPYGPVLQEAHGKALPRLRGCFSVPEHAVFLATKTQRTLDSRYTGCLPMTSLTARAVALWTWR
jgi:type IV secretory pathway protease TraF